MAAAAPPQLTKDQAKECLTTAVSLFENPENKQKLADIVAECNKVEDPMQQQMLKMTKLIPEASSMLGSELEKYGFTKDSLMMGMMQVNMLSMGDDEMQAQCKRVMSFLSGNFDA
uniref:Protein C10 n=1 Tax=Alexandrium catenella TaxID=2925 RepID=A0A7S1WPM7_ALECA|mmetsp:Transcript_79252/g.210459  ORF Transcript_79252/g.210459 Transcript_79252/m.210459 type:complete len:115 (+) Transcript_79252:96-440(+)